MSEIEAMGRDHDHRVAVVMAVAQQLLAEMDVARARVEAGEAEHSVLEQHFEALSQVSELLAELEASAPPMDELAAQVQALAADVAEPPRLSE